MMHDTKGDSTLVIDFSPLSCWLSVFGAVLKKPPLSQSYCEDASEKHTNINIKKAPPEKGH